MVPRVGIEPTLLSEPDFESGASTSSTTEATARILPEFPPILIGNRIATADKQQKKIRHDKRAVFFYRINLVIIGSITACADRH